MRSPEGLRSQYNIERELANRLWHASRTDRKVLYSAVYDELFRRVPDHPQITRKLSSKAKQEETQRQLRMINRFLKTETTYAEIGAGDCSLAVAVAHRVAKVYAVDVSAEIADQSASPTNFQLIISDGISIPIPSESVDVVYSNQLIEHLHPDDARSQLEECYKALKTSGSYICVTPNRLSGPHDISSMFDDDEPQGFHLREYTNGDLAAMFAQVGFRRFRLLVTCRSFVLPFLIPIGPFVYLESVLGKLPSSFRKPLSTPLGCLKFVAIK